MNRITPATERKLMAVIEKTAELVSDGMSPNDAVVKAATDSSLRPSEISLVVHAYNTGRTSRQRADGSDVFQKSAEFPLADASTVLERMYPTTVKTASVQRRETIVSPEYSYSPLPMLERKARWDKKAQVADWRTMHGQKIEPPPPLPVDPDHQFRVAASNIDRLKRAAEESRRQASSAFDQLGDAFMSLTSYFRRPDAKPLPVVKEAVILLHGDKGEQLMDQLVKVTPSLTKLANHRVGQSLLGQSGVTKFATTLDDLDCTAEPFNLVAAVMGCLADYKEKSAAHQTAVDTFNTEAGKTIRPFVEPAGSESIAGPLSEQEKTAVDMMNPLSLMGTYSLLNRTMQPIANKIKAPDDMKVDRAVRELNDPTHESRLREINTQAMLQDLMLNDDVISGYPSHEVTNAFNDIVQISPSVADQRMLIQNLLRKKLQQGQLDTFEQDQLLGFEDKLRRQFQPLAGKANDSIV